jgi:hypothetical protein
MHTLPNFLVNFTSWKKKVRGFDYSCVCTLILVTLGTGSGWFKINSSSITLHIWPTFSCCNVQSYCVENLEFKFLLQLHSVATRHASRLRTLTQPSNERWNMQHQSKFLNFACLPGFNALRKNVQFSLVSRLTLFNPPRLAKRPHSLQLFCGIDVLQ